MKKSAGSGDLLREHYGDVRQLSQALSSGETGLTYVPVFLLRVLQTNGWRAFVTPLDDHVVYERFEEFVTTKPVRGLGATVPLLRNLCRNHPDVQRELDKIAGPLAAHGEIGHGRRVDNVKSTNGGNSAEYLSRRLLRDAPEIFAALERGDFPSVRAAAKAAGLIHEPTTLEHLQRWWQKATPDDRLAFLRWARVDVRR